MPVQSLGWQDPLEEDMVPHSRILAWEIPWTEEPAGLQSMQFQRVRHDRASNTSTLFFSFSGISHPIHEQIQLGISL